MIADFVDVEEPGSGDVALDIFVPGAALSARHMPACVDHNEIRFAQALRQPLCRDQQVHRPKAIELPCGGR